MKYAFSILAAAAVLFTAFNAKAQDYTTLFSGTQTVAAGLSNTTPTITLTRSDEVVFFSSFKLTGAGTAGLLFRVDGSVDNSNWQTGIGSFWRAGNGTTAVESSTNISSISYPFIRVQVHNTNSVIATNWTFKAVTKRKY